MSFHENNPKKIFSDEWKELQIAVKDASHDYHLMTLSTSTNNKPESRTVVLRHADQENYLLCFHTDTRSPKYDQLKNNPDVSILFYSVNKRTQLRITGQASHCEDDELLESKWMGMNKNSKECYLGEIAPSEKIPNGEKDILQNFLRASQMNLVPLLVFGKMVCVRLDNEMNLSGGILTEN